jgi:hypothetical protein
MRVQAIPLRHTGGAARVQLIVEIPGKDLTFEPRNGQFVERLEFATVAFDTKGIRGPEGSTGVNLRLNADGRDRVIASGVRWVSVLELPHGRHDLRVAGHAVTSDRRGSVFVDVDVPDFGAEMPTSGLAVTARAALTMAATGDASLVPPLPSPATSQRAFALGDVLSVSAEVYGRGQGETTGELPANLLARVTEAASPQRVVLEQPVPVLTEGHRTPYVSFALDTRMVGPGRFVLRLVRRPQDRPADEAPGAVVFEVRHDSVTDGRAR